MHSAAEQGGGYRQSATSQVEIEQALSRIFGDIIDINTSFAAVTLPLSATNRAQAENKVFVGMFRPASQRKPRWLGNLKQYQLAVRRSDRARRRELRSGYQSADGVRPLLCHQFLTEDTSEATKAVGITGPYFADLGLEPSPVSECLSEFRGERSVLSDSPDGPFVEKGGAAQQIRGQISGTRKSARKILTQSGSSLTVLDEEDLPAGLAEADQVYAYLIGEEAGLKGGDYKMADPTTTDGLPYVPNPALSEEGKSLLKGFV